MIVLISVVIPEFLPVTLTLVSPVYLLEFCLTPTQIVTYSRKPYNYDGEGYRDGPGCCDSPGYLDSLVTW